MEYQVVVIAFIALFMLSVANVSEAKEIINAPALCEPGVMESMPPHIRKVCVALENSNQLSNALNQYIHNEAAGNYFFSNSTQVFDLHEMYLFVLFYFAPISIAVQTRGFNIAQFPSWKANRC